MKIYILLSLLLLSLLSCKNDREKEFMTQTKPIIVGDTCWSDTISKQIYNASNKGDILAYKKVFYYCWRKSRTDEILPISMIMANKYKFNEAYFHVYLSLSGHYRTDSAGINGMDNTSKYLALYYLLKAKEKGYDEATYEAEEIFKDKKIQSANSYLLKLAEE